MTDSLLAYVYPADSWYATIALGISVVGLALAVVFRILHALDACGHWYTGWYALCWGLGLAFAVPEGVYLVKTTPASIPILFLITVIGVALARRFRAKFCPEES